MVSNDEGWRRGVDHYMGVKNACFFNFCFMIILRYLLIMCTLRCTSFGIPNSYCLSFLLEFFPLLRCTYQ